MTNVQLQVEYNSRTKEMTYWRGDEEVSGDVFVQQGETLTLTITPKGAGLSFTGCLVTPVDSAPPKAVESPKVSAKKVTIVDRNKNGTNGDQLYNYELTVLTGGQTVPADPKLINRPGG